MNLYVYIISLYIYCRWSLAKGPRWTSEQLWAYSRLSQIPAIPAPLMSLEMRPATYTSHRATFQKHLNSLRSVDARGSKSRCLLVLAVNIVRFSIQLCFLLGICLRKKQKSCNLHVAAVLTFGAIAPEFTTLPTCYLTLGGWKDYKATSSFTNPSRICQNHAGKVPSKSVTSPEKSTKIHGNPWIFIPPISPPGSTLRSHRISSKPQHTVQNPWKTTEADDRPTELWTWSSPRMKSAL